MDFLGTGAPSLIQYIPFHQLKCNLRPRLDILKFYLNVKNIIVSNCFPTSVIDVIFRGHRNNLGIKLNAIAY